MGKFDAIGRYIVERELGRGGMGVVYLAVDPTLDRRVALKVLPESVSRDAEQIARFEREAKVLASINHPNIGIIHSLERTDTDDTFVVLEFIEGDMLQQHIAKAKPSIEDSLRLCKQIAEALDAAHEGGVVHRDLKPANVMLTKRGWVKVLDFGLASVGRSIAAGAPSGNSDDDDDLATADIQQTSGTGVIQGTPGYMSPEQARGEEEDQRTDVFAFGCVLFETLTAERAFQGERVSDLLHAVQHNEPDWSKLPPETPPDAIALLRHCLEKRKSHRLESLGEAARRLDDVITSGSSTITQKIERSRVTNNLPTQMSSFVGRSAELRTLREMISDTRILTLTGSGGCGKSRLAVRLAADVIEGFSDGVWFVDLGSIADEGRVAQAIMNAIGLTEARGKRDIDAVIERIGDSVTLLILDNCEHVIDECATVVKDILTRCANTIVINTSREAIGLNGESTFRVPSLSSPPTGDDVTVAEIETSESVSLFSARARAVNPSFTLNDANAPAVADICAQLDGIPLAIELAAARVKALPPAKIAERLTDVFRILTGGARGALPRQRTLRATIEWSYELLDEAERALLQRLSVFPNACTLDAAENVCADDSPLEADELVDAEPPEGEPLESWQVLDLLTSLIDKSLVTYTEREGEGRYGLLNTVRRFAAEHFEKEPSADWVHARNLVFFSELVAEAETKLLGPEQGEWLERIAQDHDTVLAAINWAHDDTTVAGAGHRAARTLGMAAALGRFWMLRGLSGFGLSIMHKILAAPPGDDPTPRAAALNAAGSMARRAGDFERSRDYLKQSMKLREELGDERGVAIALTNLANVAAEEADYDQATQLGSKALEISQRIGDQRLQGLNLGNLGQHAARQGRFEVARGMYDQALKINKSIGNKTVEASNLNNLAEVEMRMGHRDESDAFARQSIDICLEIGDKIVRPNALSILGENARARGDTADACKHQHQALSIRLSVNDQLGCAESLEACVALWIVIEHTTEAPASERVRLAKWFADTAAELRDAIGAPIPPNELGAHTKKTAELARLVDLTGLTDEHDKPDWKQVVRLALLWLTEH
jgi:predicted ATPase/predicted Ser/Thr protein kinase